ncbi:helix-turn-helix transcriptional regulator [Reticulibacter mediterranei]|uniref:Helix-turn-helix transcriptional regulator n=1 Tax=Reticulibacter mediterranei TaxID=2778369 RepID=A0A8J3IED1_9CHLR|nr:LuxR C-terminal-related transcriptional regulator [Reticulibacter mediterranei]GHO90935.1 helix-turn-helix transcriptional regulator [Reticulibacter mediterranei]
MTSPMPSAQRNLPPLLTTKLTIPPRRSNTLERPVLYQRLVPASTQPLTLISAPAGFGKTTLLATWAACDENVAWISLDASENDPLLFWSYFTAACQRGQPDLERQVAPVLQQAGPLDVEALLAVLINTLAHTSSPLLLILDDYHVVTTQEIHQQMTFLIEHLPAALHLIISTRVDPLFPLARFRARNMLNELRTFDLRFSTEETILFLQQELEAALIVQPMLDVVEDKLEGWPAGLHLLALSLKKRSDGIQWLTAWGGQHHHITTYLSEEVLVHQTAEIQEFLLCTSLFPRLTGSLCDALLERGDGTEMLESLAQANLFLTALNEEHSWYHYHHLFADVLRHRLYKTMSKERIAQLCQRACAWYLQHDLLLDAVEALVLAEDYAQAADLLERQGIPIAQGYPYTRFISWIEHFPASILTLHPDLANWYASALMMLGKLARLDYAHTTAAAGFEAQGNTSKQGMALAYNAIRSYWTGKSSAFAALCKQALPLLTDQEGSISTTRAILHGFTMLQEGQVQAAIPLFEQWLHVHEQTPTFTGFLAGCIMRRADLLWMQGQLHAAAPLYQQVMERAKVLPFPVSEAQYRWSKVLLEWNRLAESETFLQLALQEARRMQHSNLLSLGATQQARLYLARGEMTRAEATLKEAAYMAQQHQHQEAWQEALIEQGRLALLQADEEAFERWRVRMNISSGSSPSYAQEETFLLLSRWLIHHQQAKQVLALLPRWCQTAQESGRGLRVMQCSLVQVLAHAALQEQAQAFALLEQVVQQAERGDYMRLFLDEGSAMQEVLIALSRRSSPGSLYVQKLLAAFPQATPSASLPSKSMPLTLSQMTCLDPLSPREREILRLIADGATNEEIAEQLVIAYTTVKRHVSNILLKLGTSNRTQAVARAREQGWLSSQPET